MKKAGQSWKAIAMLFSGRPNPEWVLTAAQQKTWSRFWEEASLSNTKMDPPPALGYSGCTLRYDEHSHWQIFNGYVSFYEKGKAVYKKDEERQMELFLLKTAPPDIKELLMSLKII